MFNNIEEYYAFLETQTQLLKSNYLSSKISQMCEQTSDEHLKELMSFEMYFEDFNMIASELSLSDAAVDYLKNRANKIQNKKLKARYNHILWQKTKNRNFVQLAIDNYLIILQDSNFNIEENLHNQAFATIFKTLFTLAQDVKYKKTDVLTYLTIILGKHKINGYQESVLMKLVAKDGKSIPRETLETLYNYAHTVINNAVYPEFVKEYLEVLIILTQKINQPVKVYQDKLGEYFVQKAQSYDGFPVHGQYIKALEQFKRSGNNTRFEEVSVLIQKAKSNLNFAKTEIEVNDDSIKDLFEKMDNEIDNLIAQLNSSQIYDHLTLSTDIFPSANILDVEVLPATFELVHVMVFDGNGNLDSKAKGGIRPYAIHIQNFSLTFLSWIFFKGIKSRKLSFETLYNHLLENTWYGEDNAYINNERNPETFKWLDLLAPSLQSFFTQMQNDIELNIVSNNAYQLPIDSLTVKFEGLLRAFSDRLEAQTIDLKDTDTQERISFEKLFDNPKFTKIIPPDDIALFKYLFTSKGMNYRNNVAHCFYKPKNYSVAMMWFLIVAVLKLGNYKFTSKQS